MTEIVFAPLDSSPDTVGEGTTSLPRLRAYGQEGAGAYSISRTPRLSLVSSGVVQDSVFGTSSGAIPALRLLAGQAAGGYSSSALPLLTAYGRDASELVPEAGFGYGTIPLLSLLATGTEHKTATGVGYLPRLRTLSLEPSGDYGISVLPKLNALATQAAPPTGGFQLYQEPGYVYAYAQPYTAVMAEEMTFSHEVTGEQTVWAVVDALQVTGQAFTSANYLAVLDERLAFTTTVRLITEVLVEEGLLLTDSAQFTHSQVVAIVDRLRLTGTATSTMVAIVQIAEALALADLTRSVHDAQLDETLAFAEQLQAMVTAYETLLASLVFSDEAVGTAVLSVEVSDALALAAEADVVATMIASIQDGLAFTVGFVFDDTPYLGLALNTATNGVSTYTNYPFESMAVFNGQLYGATDEGLFREGGDTDNGTEIVWRLRTGMTNLGTGRAKALDAAYLGYTATGRILLKCIVVNAAGEKIAYWYEMQPQEASNLRPGRILTGRGMRSVYWAFELTNVDAGDISLDVLDLHPLVLEGRLPQ